MSYSVWGTIAEIPWWIYLILISLLNTAYQATKPHYVYMKSAVYLPMIVNGILFFAMFITISFDPHKFFLLISLLFPGVFLGWLQFRLRRIKAIKNTSQFYVPGSFSVLIILFLLIAAKIYFYGFDFTVTLDTVKQESNMNIIVLSCGLILGLTIGRTYYLYRCMKYGPYLEQ